MTTSETTGELLAPDDVARETRVSRATVYRAIRTGQLRAVRLGEDGRVLRVPRAAVEAWLRPTR